MKAKAAHILNREGTMPSDGWYQIEVAGEHPAGEGRMQVIDQLAMESIVNSFREEKKRQGEYFTGLLVDRDHLSHDLAQTTEAMAWVKDVDIRNGELHAQLDFTSTGREAVEGKVYKFFSTEYPADGLENIGDGRVRPRRLSGLALTNRPNNRGGKPISNRADDLGGGQTKETKPSETQPSMTTIAEKLGLPADADEAAITAAITALIQERDELKKTTTEAAADAVMNRVGNRIPEAARPHWREQLIANRAATEKLIDASFPAASAAPAPAIHNRGAASPPPVEKTMGTDSASKATEQEAYVRGIMNRSSCGYSKAWEQAKLEKPDLFQ